MLNFSRLSIAHHLPLHLRHPSLSPWAKAEPPGPELEDSESGGCPLHSYTCCTPTPRARGCLEPPPLVLPQPACVLLIEAGLASVTSGSSVPGLATGHPGCSVNVYRMKERRTEGQRDGGRGALGSTCRADQGRPHGQNRYKLGA